MNKKENPILAFENIEFLNSSAARAIRLQAEYTFAYEVLKANHINYTVVIFGGARIRPKDFCEAELRKIEKKLEKDSTSRELKKELKKAKLALDQSKYYQLAYDMSRLVSESTSRGDTDVYVVTGGGPGIMEAGNRGAHDSGTPSVSLNIKLPFEQYPNPYVTEKLCFNFHYFSIRKMHFLVNARALCAFPGGFGTLDEIFETLTLIQTKKIQKMPVLLFGSDFWKSLINWEQLVNSGVIAEEDLDLFHFCDDANEGWEFIKNYWEKVGFNSEIHFI